ncbi:MAG: ABC transporter permease [Actinomycetota bacterium]|nr:ABC transporter permease [Actinomycetota bacterium]
MNVRIRRLARSRLLVAGVCLMAFFILVAIFAPVLASYDPRVISGDAFESPSARHWLGTDVPGHDIFAQLVYGARSSLTVAAIAGTLALTGAVLLGVLPALLGGWADRIFNGTAIFLLALPGLPLLVLVGSLAGNNHLAIILLIGFIGVAPNARILRSQALSLRQRGYITAARGFGGGPLYVLRRHLVPGIAPLIVVGFVNWAGVSIGLQAGLAFLGLGDPSAVNWGNMLNRALSQQGIYFSDLWTWWVLPAGFAVALAVLAFTFVGVGLEPTFNPRWLRSS